MAGIIIDIETERLSSSDFATVIEETYNFILALSPYDQNRKSGPHFVSFWKDPVIKYPRARIENTCDYGEYLDDGWSDQAPNGITDPAQEFAQNLAEDYYA